VMKGRNPDVAGSESRPFITGHPSP
jgi:hypothetical protein